MKHDKRNSNVLALLRRSLAVAKHMQEVNKPSQAHATNGAFHDISTVRKHFYLSLFVVFRLWGYLGPWFQL